MTLYCGIDLHSNNVLISIINENDQLVSEKRLTNSLPLILTHLSPYQTELSGVVVESTYNWYWLVDGLMEAGYPVLLANTVAIQQYQGIKHTNDASDARYLAHLLRLGILPTGYIYPQPLRFVRDLLRRRLLLVQQRTAQLLSLQTLLARHTGQHLPVAKIKQLTVSTMPELLTQTWVCYCAQQMMCTILQLGKQITEIETVVEKQCQQYPQYELIISTPGIGRILGMTILLETGDIKRFMYPSHYASYARCVPSDKISNGKSKGQNNRKNGNRYLAMAFVEAAHYAAIWDDTIKRHYQRKCKTAPLMVAKKAIANKLARACYHMLKNNEGFDVNKAFR